ncbi:pilus assembly protein [Nocardioides sp. CBS4Y-1]|uniref:Pilus assembly protein n=2 Tax=Nocardioides acrostichi TaxID=2784339 RepID=A0A930V132_9ACTN|nr:pilus assembly protein [Nocardioides acrostichi]
MAVEVVLLTPAMVAFFLLVVAFGRYVAVQGDIDAAARDAARQASLQANAGAARSAAYAVIASSLDDHTHCGSPGVGGTWGAGGEVTITLNCRVDYSGLGLIGVPGSVGIDTTSAAPLDPYRSYE